MLADEFVNPHTSVASATAGIRSFTAYTYNVWSRYKRRGVSSAFTICDCWLCLGAEDWQLLRTLLPMSGWTEYHVYQSGASALLIGHKSNQFDFLPHFEQSELVLKVEIVRSIGENPRSNQCYMMVSKIHQCPGARILLIASTILLERFSYFSVSGNPPCKNRHFSRQTKLWPAG